MADNKTLYYFSLYVYYFNEDAGIHIEDNFKYFRIVRLAVKETWVVHLHVFPKGNC